MFYVWASILCVANLAWLVLTAMGLPGNWLMLASAGAMLWAYWPERVFSPWTLGVAVFLALLAEGVEFAAGLAGAKKAGAGRSGALGALAGSLAGGIAGTVFIPVPLIGSLLGAVVGAAAGAMFLEAVAGRPVQAVARVGAGSALGRLLGTGFKLAVGVLIWIVLTVAVFWR